jgi:hypothetical protein
VSAPRRGLAPFLAVLMLGGLSSGLARVVTSLQAVALGAGPLELGLLAASQSLALVLMSVPSGALVRRHGSRRIFVAGSLAGGLACAAVPTLGARAFLHVATATVGLCMPMRFVATNVVALRNLEAQGGARAGWYRGCHLLSMFLVGPAVAVPTAALLGLAGAWYVVAASFVVAAVCAPLALGGEGRAREATARVTTARRDPEAWPLVANEFASQGAFTAFSFFIVPIAIGRYGATPAAAAGLLTAQATSFVLALFGIGGAASRWPRGRFVLVAYGTATAALLALGGGRSVGALWAGSLLLGVGLGLLQTDNLVRASRVGARAGPDAAAGLQSLSGSTGGLASGIVGGLVGARVGVQGLFVVLAALYAVLAWRERGRVTRATESAEAATGTGSSRSPASASEPAACEG